MATAAMLRKMLAIGVAALVVTVGGAAAVSGHANSHANGSDDGSANATAAGDAGGPQGPPGDLPGQVPEFVSQIHDLVQRHLQGTLDDLGGAVSDLVGGDASPSDEATGHADGHAGVDG